MPASTSALLTLAAASLAGIDARPPVFLTAVEQAGRIVVQVRGRAEAAFVARYTLETVSGSNRAHQTGSARLMPSAVTYLDATYTPFPVAQCYPRRDPPRL